MKIESNKCINIKKIAEYLETDVEIKLAQIHVVVKKVSQWKRKAQASKHNWCLMKMLKSLFKLLATLEKKERLLLKQGCDYINK